jgi:hypothetical protein
MHLEVPASLRIERHDHARGCDLVDDRLHHRRRR